MSTRTRRMWVVGEIQPMNIEIFRTQRELGAAAARRAAEKLRALLGERPQVHVVAATGLAQFTFLDALVTEPRIDWHRTVFFHLDEYVGLPETHPASFRRYLRERLADRVHPGAFHFIEGDAPDPEAERRRLNDLIRDVTIDLAFVGIGENGHLAFNDPPADFETNEPYLIVELDEACRRQQLGEGWFPRLEDVPRRAISMSVRQILRSRTILCIAPERRKAQAVRDCLEAPVSPAHPASILRQHPDVFLYLDPESASLLSSAPRAR